MALLLLCFGAFTAPRSLENPSAFSRTYQSDGGGNIQNAGNILCHSVSLAPRYRRPFVCSQGEEETDKGQGLGGGWQPAPLLPWFVLPHDNVPNFLTKTAITMASDVQPALALEGAPPHQPCTPSHGQNADSARSQHALWEIQRGFCPHGKQGPIVLRLPLPHCQPPSPRILWAVAHLGRFSRNSEGGQVGGEKWAWIQGQGPEKESTG